jgi:hypothetical protein
MPGIETEFLTPRYGEKGEEGHTVIAEISERHRRALDWTE